VFERGWYLFVGCICEAKVRLKEGRTEGQCLDLGSGKRVPLMCVIDT